MENRFGVMPRVRLTGEINPRSYGFRMPNQDVDLLPKKGDIYEEDSEDDNSEVDPYHKELQNSII